MKTYLYSDLINNDYLYSIDNDIIKVYKNCIGNNCTCENVYIKNDYIRSQEYQCSNENIILLNKDIFTDNFYYRQDLFQILSIFMIFCFVIIYCPIKIFGRLYRCLNI